MVASASSNTTPRFSRSIVSNNTSTSRGGAFSAEELSFSVVFEGNI
ncbi:hypothetical protein [Pseudovibrio sp. SPO723]